ncbi:hypothetical protein [Sphingomonas sp. Y38-1Y]|nr:hypothetical protein [Sphingomonas sp. Y38-1Y]
MELQRTLHEIVVSNRSRSSVCYADYGNLHRNLSINADPVLD